MNQENQNNRHIPWNKGKLIGQKSPLKLKEIWAIRIRLQMDKNTRELALFNLAIDSKLRGCDLVKLKVSDVAQGGRVSSRAIIMPRLCLPMVPRILGLGFLEALNNGLVHIYSHFYYEWGDIMASIRQLQSGKWNVQIRHKGQKPISKTFNTKKEAEAFLKKLSKPGKVIPEATLRHSEPQSQATLEQCIAHPQITLWAALRRYEREISPRKKSYQTDIYRIRIILGTFLSGLLLHEIKPHHLIQYRDLRMETVTGDTVNRELAILSHLFNVAGIDWGYSDWLKDNPLRLVRKPKPNKSRDRRVTQEELNSILQQLPEQSPTALLIELAFLTSMRRGELLSIKYENINFDERTVLLPDTKNGESRTVPLSSRAVEILRVATKDTNSAGTLFTIHLDTLGRSFRKAAAAAGVSGVRFHDLRHSAISGFIEKGLSIMEASSISGHKSFSMLRRYTHLRPSQLALKLG